MSATPRPTGFVVKGWHVLAGLILFFGIDMAVNTYFMVSAYRTFPGETSLTPYEDGVAYNATLKQHRAQAVLGWRLAAGVDDSGRIRVDARDRQGAPLNALRVTAHMRRPATDSGERDLSLAGIGPGEYAAAPGPLTGAWDVEVSATDGAGRVAMAARRLVLP